MDQQRRFFGSPESFQQKYGREIEKVGKANTGSPQIRVGRHYIKAGGGYGYYLTKNPFYRSPEDVQQAATKEVSEQFKALEASQAKSFEQQQSEIAEQLKILQEEKTLNQQLVDDYLRMMKKERRIGRRTEKQRIQSLQIARENAARATAGGGLQIQYGGGVAPSSGGFMPQMGGTSQFKTRQSNMVNI